MAARWMVSVAALALMAGGCGMRREGSRLVDMDAGPRQATTEEFIADQIATPTEVPTRSAMVSNEPVTIGGDVAVGAGPAAAAAGSAVAAPAGAGAGPGARLGVADEAMGVSDVAVVVGGPRLGPGAASGPVELVDAKVGEINGRAVRLSEMLETYRLGPRMAATAADLKAKRQPRQRWVDSTRVLVRNQLTDILRDELLQAEARAALKEPQKQGLRAFVQETQEDIRRTIGEGGRAKAQQRLEEEGLSIQRVVNDEERRALVDFQLQQQVRNRVRVSWKDVRLYYERNSDKFNPPPTLQLRMIRVSESDAASVEEITRRLAGGEDFGEVARIKANAYRPENGGAMPEVKVEGTLAKTEVFPKAGRLAVLNEKVSGLKPREFAGPVPLGEGAGREVAWVYLEEVREIKRPLSDNDVQLEIVDTLTSERRARELELYFKRLTDRASFTSLEEMVDRIVELAGERYWPKG